MKKIIFYNKNFLLGGNTKEVKLNTIKEAEQLGVKQKNKLKNVRH